MKAVRDGTRSKRTHYEDLAHQLESDVLSGVLAPGTRLDEVTLARQFGVSRTPVREALRQLASSGLIEIRPHHGAVVRQLTLPDLIEMFQVIAELEGLSARLASRRIIQTELAGLRHSHETCKRHALDHDEDLFIAENHRLHDAILLASRNNFLITQVRELTRRVNPYRRIVTQSPGVMEKSIIEHAAVIAAIERRDGAAAHELMRNHLNMLGEEAGDFVASMVAIGQPIRTKFTAGSPVSVSSPAAAVRPSSSPSFDPDLSSPSGE